MKVFIYVTMIILINMVLYYILNVGYFRGELHYYDAVNAGDFAYYLHALLRFDLMVVIFNVFLLFFNCRFLVKSKLNKSKIILCLLIGAFIFNIINSLAFAIKNYIANYHEIFELNVFVVLLEKYGAIINLVYIVPLILSVLIFIIFLFFMSKQKHQLLHPKNA